MADMGKMIGPLPLGAWAAVVAGGLGIMLYSRKQTASVAPTPVNDVSGVPGVGTGGSGMVWQNVAPTGAGTSVAPTTITTNEEWARAATNWLIASNYDAAMSDSAVRKYISGGQGMSVSENMLITLALGHFGAPPQTLPPPVVTTADAPPASQNIVRFIRNAGTGWVGAQYDNGVTVGIPNPDQWLAIQASNPQIPTSNLPSTDPFFRQVM